MDIQNQFPLLKSNRSEKVNYDSTEYFSYVRKGLLSAYPNYQCLCHWHEDIELIYILDGEMDYFINSETLTLHKGEGLFVNSKQLHYGYSHTHNECEFLCVLLHPMLLCITKSLEEKYILPITESKNFAYMIFHNETDWQRRINNLIQNIYLQRNVNTYPLRFQTFFYELWTLLYENMPLMQFEETKSDATLHLLKQLLHYVEDNYHCKITIQELATYAHISESSCFKLFRIKLGQTPVEYITRYRLERAIQLMKTTSKSLTEISFEVGFSSLSFFSEQFKKNYNISPREYKRELHS